MASLSLYPQFETNLMSTRKVIEPVLQFKSAKADDKNYIKVKPHLVRHLLRNRLLAPLKHERSHFIRNWFRFISKMRFLKCGKDRAAKFDKDIY